MSGGLCGCRVCLFNVRFDLHQGWFNFFIPSKSFRIQKEKWNILFLKYVQSMIVIIIYFSGIICRILEGSLV